MKLKNDRAEGVPDGGVMAKVQAKKAAAAEARRLKALEGRAAVIEVL